MSKALQVHPLVIGIDPDLDKNGVAIVTDGQVQELNNLNFMELMKFCSTYHQQAVFVLEDVEHNKPVFNRRLKPLQNLKVAQNVGMVKGVARLIAQFLETGDYRFIKVRPLRGELKGAKKNRAYFNQITGWSKSSNEDNRDAALLAKYGFPRHLYVPRPSEVPH